MVRVHLSEVGLSDPKTREEGISSSLCPKGAEQVGSCMAFDRLCGQLSV